MELNREQIIKALECCADTTDIMKCQSCPYIQPRSGCNINLMRDALALIRELYAKTVTEDGKAIVDAVRDIVAVTTPTADVVEVVRCRDCKYGKKLKDGGTSCKRIDGLRMIHPDDYCSYGERSENGT